MTRFPGRAILLSLAFAAPLALPAQTPVAARAAPAKAVSSQPPGYTLSYTGGAHDFDYFQGAWTTRQRRLKQRGVGSDQWKIFPATLCMREYLGGKATVDELYFPTKGWAGLTLRTCRPASHTWSIYWVSDTDGKLGPPVVGGFHGNRGEFYGEDHDQGRPVKVRFIWIKLDHDHSRREQAFSYDDRRWETNWIADFVGADPGKASLMAVRNAETPSGAPSENDMTSFRRIP
ncbi:MAG TPA: hypothetical protein VN624_13200 [Rhodanobacter sp.]|nr:hypothetical protein [Rhodanobacter sp.]